MNNEFKKSFKKKDKMKNKSSLLGFALTGMAVGAAAWYLFGTKEGRKNLNCAIEGINEFSNTLKDKANEGLECASDFAAKAKKMAKQKFEEGKSSFEDATDEIKQKGNRLKDEAEDLGRQAGHSAESLAEDAKNKIQ